MYKTDWSNVKSLYDAGTIDLKFIEDSQKYTIWGFDNNFVLECIILKDNGAEQTEFEASYKSLSNKRIEPKTQTGNIPKVSIYEPEGYSRAYVSHDFTDPCTWYSDSVEVTGETLTGGTLNKFNSANNNWIDLTHGRHTREDEMSNKRIPKIYDNGVLKTEGTDYTIDYENGDVTFTYNPTEPVTADYWYENGSTYVLAPSAGKVIRIEHAELDFSVDLTMSKVHFEVWAYNPLDLPNKALVDKVTYKNEKDILAIANTVEEISAWGSLTQAVKRAEFDYGRTIDLKSSLGMELRIVIDNDTPFSTVASSSFGTITFYTAEDDE